MSARKAAIQLTSQAERDYESILVYTERTWEEKQSAIYQASIAQALSALRDHPQASRPRDDLFPGCRSIQVEQHVIYFHQPRADEIELQGPLHLACVLICPGFLDLEVSLKG
jgi:toxin ParE1/3/4